MAGRPVVVHLLGFPGTGKLTVARALAERAAARGRRFVVVDNHLTGDAVLTVVGADGVSPVDPAVWGYVGEVRDVVVRAIRELSPADWSFVFTNVITTVDPQGPSTIARLRDLAAARSSDYVPVVLRCEPDELRRRVVSPGRRAHHKWVDADAVAAFTQERQLVRPGSPRPLELDVTDLAPADTATAILAHLDRAPHP